MCPAKAGVPCELLESDWFSQDADGRRQCLVQNTKHPKFVSPSSGSLTRGGPRSSAEGVAARSAINPAWPGQFCKTRDMAASLQVSRSHLLKWPLDRNRLGPGTVLLASDVFAEYSDQRF